MEENNVVIDTEEEKPLEVDGGKKRFGVAGIVKKLFSPEKRIWTIAILGVFVLLVIGIIFVSTYFSPQNVALRFVKAMQYDDVVTMHSVMAYDNYQYLLKDKAEAEYFEERSDYYEEDIDNWKTYSKLLKERTEDYLFEEYGEYKITFEATREKDISKRKLESEVDLEYLENKTDFNIDQVSKVKTVTVKMKIEGEEKVKRYTYTVYMVKVGLFWKALDAE